MSARRGIPPAKMQQTPAGTGVVQKYAELCGAAQGAPMPPHGREAFGVTSNAASTLREQTLVGGAESGAPADTSDFAYLRARWPGVADTLIETVVRILNGG